MGEEPARSLRQSMKSSGWWRRAAARAARAPGVVTPAGWGVLLAGVLLHGCTPPQLLTLRSGLDSLRVVVDTLAVHDSLTFRMLTDTRRELLEQRDILLSTRASSGSTTQEMFEQMSRLEAKLDEAMQRFQTTSQRAPVSTPAQPGVDPNQIYDQAAQDLTQGRYSMAQQGFREFVQRFPTAELADNAQYGLAECYFAQSVFDTAAVEYARVDSLYPKGDKVPAALYKRGLSLEKLGQAPEAKRTFEELIRRFPHSGEAQLARERLGTTRR
jgi:tol-pal system protein YbgF